MDKKYLQLKEPDEFFTELHLKCLKKNSYSLFEIFQEMGVSFDEVKNWVLLNENWLYILEVCIEICNIHIQDAELSGLLTEGKTSEYLRQNQSLKE